MEINIITLFPGFFYSPLKIGILGRAVQSGFLKVHFANLRDFTEDNYQSVDDSPFGGGDGMVMKYEPLKKAVESFSNKKIIYLSPQGKKWDYKTARACAEQNENLTFICGRYGGVDQRFINEYVEEEISIGDYVLSGGEPALLVILDSLSRFIKGALGNECSVEEESFEQDHLLEAPQWTRPQEITGYKIPEVILSGHHKNIQNFRYLMSVLVTAVKRPDLLKLNPAGQKDLPKAIKMIQAFSQEELNACGISAKYLTALKQYL